MSGFELRNGRLFDPETDTTVMIALSNAMYFGPTEGMQSAREFRTVLGAAIEGGCDAVMISPGALRANVDLLCGKNRPSIILSACYTNVWRSPERFGYGGHGGEQAAIVSVEDAVRMGADAYHLYTFMGWQDPKHELCEIERLGQICEAARKWSLPVLCEPLARGDAVPKGRESDPDIVGTMARTAAEVGADIVKVEYTGDPESFRPVVEASSAPVVMMGGAKTESFEGFLAVLSSAMTAGARGVAIGRNICSQPNPTRAVAQVVETIRTASKSVKHGAHKKGEECTGHANYPHRNQRRQDT